MSCRWGLRVCMESTPRQDAPVGPVLGATASSKPAPVVSGLQVELFPGDNWSPTAVEGLISSQSGACVGGSHTDRRQTICCCQHSDSMCCAWGVETAACRNTKAAGFDGLHAVTRQFVAGTDPSNGSIEAPMWTCWPCVVAHSSRGALRALIYLVGHHGCVHQR